MKLHSSQDGFSVFELVLVVIVLGIIAIAGLRLLNANNNLATTTGSTAASPTQKAPAVKSTSDLDKAQNTLNQNDPTTTNSSDNNQLNSQLSGLN